MSENRARKRLKRMLRDGYVKTRDVYQNRPFTCVFLVVGLPEGERGLSAVGFSKVMRPDRWDPRMGVKIAEGRALDEIARTLLDEDPSLIPDIDKLLREEWVFLGGGRP